MKYMDVNNDLKILEIPQNSSESIGNTTKIQHLTSGFLPELMAIT